jgi:tetratricopeptide (TPR) repeat protein
MGEAAIARNPAHFELLDEVLHAYNDRVSRFYMTRDSRKQIARHLELADRLVKLRGNTPDTLDQIGLANSQAGKAKALEGDDEAALMHLRRNVEIQTQLVTLRPNSNNAKRNLSIAWVNVGDLALGPVGPNSFIGTGGPQLLLDPKRRAEAIEAYSKGLEQARLRHQSDPKSDQVRLDVAIVLGRTAGAHPPADPRAIPMLEESLAILDSLPVTMIASTLLHKMIFQATLAERRRQNGQRDLADAAWLAAEETYRRRLALPKPGPSVHTGMIPIYLNWAMELARRKNRAGALSLARKGEQLAIAVGSQPQMVAHLSWHPRVKGWFATVHELLGDHASARAERDASAEMWRKLSLRTGLPPKLLAEAKAGGQNQ